MCTARCGVLTTSSPTCLVAFGIAPALPIVLNISQSASLAQLASWSCISMVHIRFNDALILLTSGVFPIVSAAVYSLLHLQSPFTTPDSACSLIRPPGLVCQLCGFVLTPRTFPSLLEHIPLHLAQSTNPSAVQFSFNTSRLHLLDPMGSWWPISTWARA